MASLFVRSSKAFIQSSILKKPLPYAYFSTASPNNEQYDKMVKNNKVVVFMKGVPDQPMCGFSNAVVQIFRMHGVKYDAHNVLADEALRQGEHTTFKQTLSKIEITFVLTSGIKEFSNWPTIPQIYIGGEFVGGCDILLQMHKNGELVEELQKVGITSALLEQESKKE